MRGRQERNTSQLLRSASWRKFMPRDIEWVGAQQTLDAQLYLYGMVLSLLDNLVWEAAAALGMDPVGSVQPTPVEIGGLSDHNHKAVCGYHGLAALAKLDAGVSAELHTNL